MNALLEAADEVCTFMSERQWKFCIIGGLAVQQWGEPRTTLDADFTLLTGWGEEDGFVRALLDRFECRLENAFEFAISRRILLIRASNGTDIDIALGALPFEVSMIERAIPRAFSPRFVLPCCTAEDLFIMKVFAGRARDWLDAESIVKRQSRLNANYVLDYIREFSELKEAPEMFSRAKQLLEGAR